MNLGLKGGGGSIDADSGPLGCLHFDAVVGEVKKNLLLFRLALATLWDINLWGGSIKPDFFSSCSLNEA